MTLDYRQLPYTGALDLTLEYGPGDELSFTGIVLHVFTTSSGGVLEVAGNGLDAALAEPGLRRARLVLTDGTLIAGDVTRVNRPGRRFVLAVDGYGVCVAPAAEQEPRP